MEVGLMLLIFLPYFLPLACTLPLFRFPVVVPEIVTSWPKHLFVPVMSMKAIFGYHLGGESGLLIINLLTRVMHV